MRRANKGGGGGWRQAGRRKREKGPDSPHENCLYQEGKTNGVSEKEGGGGNKEITCQKRRKREKRDYQGKKRGSGEGMRFRKSREKAPRGDIV